MPALKKAAVILAFSGAMLGQPMATRAEQCVLKSFSVNDYGKIGPERDALTLLDKYVKEWAVKEGIEHYSMGKKTVDCKLFLDVVLFDEYTCTAVAKVCWSAPRRASRTDRMVRSQ
jgi:hypothetical protein